MTCPTPPLLPFSEVRTETKCLTICLHSFPIHTYHILAATRRKSKKSKQNCSTHRRFSFALPRARSQINCACVCELTSGLRKKLNFRRTLNWINFFLDVTFQPQIQNTAKHWFLQIIFFENVMGISILFISLKRTFFKIKRNPCLAGCKKEHKLSNRWLNTQIE